MIDATTAAAFWWGWAGPVSTQLLLLVPIVALLDRLIGRRGWTGLQATLWTVVMLRLIVPPIPAEWLSIAPLVDMRLAEALRVPTTARAFLLPAFLFWLAGVVLFGAVAIARYRVVRRTFGQSDGSLSPEVTAVAARAASALRLRTVPRITVRDQVTTPFVLGITRPVVVLPTTANAAGRPLLEHALLHELAHVKRRDALANACCLALQILYWFHPLVWVARRRLSALREIGCDADAAAAAGDRAAYRRTLLLMARPLAAPAGAALGLFGPRSELLMRLSVLERPPARWSMWWRALSAAAGLLLLATSAIVGARAPIEP